MDSTTGCCRCCYSFTELITLCGPVLDVFTLISDHPEENAQTGACRQCYEFLQEVHYFRYECNAFDNVFHKNLDAKPVEVELLSRNAINEESSQLNIKTEPFDEFDETDQIDIESIKLEADSDAETLQQILESIPENLRSRSHLMRQKRQRSIRSPEQLHDSTDSTDHNDHSYYQKLQPGRGRGRPAATKTSKKPTFSKTPLKCENCSFETREEHLLIVHRILHCKGTKRTWKIEDDPVERRRKKKLLKRKQKRLNARINDDKLNIVSKLMLINKNEDLSKPNILKRKKNMVEKSTANGKSDETDQICKMKSDSEQKSVPRQIETKEKNSDETIRVEKVKIGSSSEASRQMIDSVSVKHYVDKNEDLSKSKSKRKKVFPTANSKFDETDQFCKMKADSAQKSDSRQIKTKQRKSDETIRVEKVKMGSSTEASGQIIDSVPLKFYVNNKVPRIIITRLEECNETIRAEKVKMGSNAETSEQMIDSVPVKLHVDKSEDLLQPENKTEQFFSTAMNTSGNRYQPGYQCKNCSFTCKLEHLLIVHRVLHCKGGPTDRTADETKWIQPFENFEENRTEGAASQSSRNIKKRAKNTEDTEETKELRHIRLRLQNEEKRGIRTIKNIDRKLRLTKQRLRYGKNGNKESPECDKMNL